jgi:hypothetical protein
MNSGAGRASQRYVARAFVVSRVLRKPRMHDFARRMASIDDAWRALIDDVGHDPFGSVRVRDGLAGWAFRTRTGESVRGLSDWNFVTTAPEVGQAWRRRPFARELRDMDLQARPRFQQTILARKSGRYHEHRVGLRSRRATTGRTLALASSIIEEAPQFPRPASPTESVRGQACKTRLASWRRPGAIYAGAPRTYVASMKLVFR